MNEVLEKVGRFGVIPVVVIDKVADAEPLADALTGGGLPCVEVTFRTAAAAGVMKKLSRMKDLLIGAGTVLTVDQVKMAVDSGASFVVSPGFSAGVVEYCVANRIATIPGACTPTEIGMALEAGVNVVKYFPAETCGGLETLKIISSPYPMVKFVPTGGINIDNLRAYLEFPRVLACGGTWMVKQDFISAGKLGEVKKLVEESVRIVRRVRG